MEKLNDILATQQFVGQPISVVILDLILCMILVSVVSWYYKKFSQSLGGKTHVGSVLPLIGLTVFMVIVVVKSSLALSLGLVGALSIVRFRTPIKEPEELGYLFLTIAVGLGFGAGYKIITIITTTSILLYLYLTTEKNKSNKINGEYTILLNVLNNQYNECCKLLEKKTVAFKVIRMESHDKRITVYFNVTIDSNFDLQNLIESLKILDEGSKVDFVESGVNW
jgi:uncharacterized membrane protein YhiD involved in acid resistance|tara:strand:- start:6 stop:677 length:672 start_codon:yes stop_codon:yes gene_type:complete